MLEIQALSNVNILHTINNTNLAGTPEWFYHHGLLTPPAQRWAQCWEAFSCLCALSCSFFGRSHGAPEPEPVSVLNGDWKAMEGMVGKVTSCWLNTIYIAHTQFLVYTLHAALIQQAWQLTNVDLDRIWKLPSPIFEIYSYRHLYPMTQCS